MQELRRLLRILTEQAGCSGKAAIDANGFQRDQTSYHYRNRADCSFQSPKTTTLVDMNLLPIRNLHYTTRKSWGGHIGSRSSTGCGRPTDFATNTNYLWSDLRENCRDESTRPLIKHKRIHR